MSNTPFVTFSNGKTCPILGLGTWKSKPGEVAQAVMDAIDIGYRHIDCAPVYCNEAEVGAAVNAKINEGVIKREDIFITSKLWCTYHREDFVEQAIRTTLKDLNLEYLDLYLVHFPCSFKSLAVEQLSSRPTDLNCEEFFPRDESGKLIHADVDLTETWRGMEHVANLGLAKSIGISNFNKRQVETVLAMATIKPATNQVEVHPYLNQEKLIQFCKSVDISVTAYSPLASPDRPWAKPGEPNLLEEQKILQIAQKYKKTPGQILVRYPIERGLIVIPKSVCRQRIEDNFNVFDFELSAEDVETLASLECNGRVVLMEDRDNKEYPFFEEY